jgi:histidinol phosphatase-like enzyme (inositol monophosphatase family)
VSKDLLTAVEECARLAGGVALGYYSERPAAEIKADGSPVTVADRAAEEAARRWITERFPGDAVLGEEFGDTAGGRRRWIIDPIDGTKSFIRGVPLWGTLVAICEEETVLAGAIYCAAVGEMLVAAAGEGCWLNGSRVRVSEVSSLATATVLSSAVWGEGPAERATGWRRLAEKAAVGRTWGDCYGYLLVSSGRAEVMVDPIVSAWDIAAVQRCVVEAGGVFTDWSGAPTAFSGSAVATNSALAREVRGLLQ